MATRPTKTAQWDSNDTNSTEPATSYMEDGWSDGEIPPAAWWNWVWQLNANWIAYLAAIIDSNEEHTYQSTKSRTLVIPGQEIRPGLDGSWQIPLNADGGIRADTDSSFAYLPLNRRLPSGATLQTVEVLVTPGAARAGGNRMEVFLQNSTPDFATPGAPTEATIDNQEDDGTTNDQVITLSSLAEAVDNEADSLWLAFESGNNASSNPDFVWAVRLTFDDAGPRNF